MELREENMHRPIQDGLEDYLAGRTDAAKLKSFHEHLAICEPCREQVERLAGQARLIRTLRAPAAADPAPGFYARVIERIEAQRANSLWSIFLEPWMARRIAYASLCLLVLLGSAVLTTGPVADPAMAATPVAIMGGEPMPVADGSDPHHDRTVVLTTLAAFSGGVGGDTLPTSSD